MTLIWIQTLFTWRIKREITNIVQVYLRCGRRALTLEGRACKRRRGIIGGAWCLTNDAFSDIARAFSSRMRYAYTSFRLSCFVLFDTHFVTLGHTVLRVFVHHNHSNKLLIVYWKTMAKALRIRDEADFSGKPAAVFTGHPTFVFHSPERLCDLFRTYIHPYIHASIRTYVHTCRETWTQYALVQRKQEAYIRWKTYTGTHTRARTYVHTYTQTDTHAYMNSFMHTLWFMYIHVHIPFLMLHLRATFRTVHKLLSRFGQW